MKSKFEQVYARFMEEHIGARKGERLRLHEGHGHAERTNLWSHLAFYDKKRPGGQE